MLDDQHDYGIGAAKCDRFVAESAVEPTRNTTIANIKPTGVGVNRVYYLSSTSVGFSTGVFDLVPNWETRMSKRKTTNECPNACAL